MWKSIIIITIIVSSCSDSIDSTHRNDIFIDRSNTEQFIIPNNLNLKRELVIAAYYEIHPQKACVIIAFSDTTQTNVRKLSYSNDSIFNLRQLKKISYNEFKDETASETYIINPFTVVWMQQKGSFAMSTEYKRVDIQ